MLSVKMWLRLPDDKELATPCVFAGVGHAESAAHMFVGIAGRFALNVVSGAPSASTIWATSLYDKIWDAAVKGQAVVKFGLSKLGEILYRAWRMLGIQLHREITLFGGNGRDLFV